MEHKMAVLRKFEYNSPQWRLADGIVVITLNNIFKVSRNMAYMKEHRSYYRLGPSPVNFRQFRAS